MRLPPCLIAPLLAPFLAMATAAADEGSATSCAAPATPACLSGRPMDAACGDEVGRHRRSVDAYRLCLMGEYRRLTDRPR